MTPTIQIHVAEGGTLPTRASEGAAGYDLVARQGVTLAPGARALVPTGLWLAIPEGWEAQVRPRSGLALRHGVTVLNSPGTIDSDYRGEVGVILINLGEAPVTLAAGERVAQLVFAPVATVQWQAVDRQEALPESGRGDGGFGSTGGRS